MEYAQVLKDASGRPSGYRECGGEVCYMPLGQQSYENIFRRIKIDTGTMKVINREFIIDRERVYRRGILLKGISPEGFHTFNAVFTGNHQVVYTPDGNAKIAHPESFEALDGGGVPDGQVFPRSYGRDREFVYFYSGSTDTPYAVRMRACKNPGAFTVLTWGFAKDDRHVYHGRFMIKGADPKTFEVLTDGRARDKKHLFQYGHIIA